MKLTGLQLLGPASEETLDSIWIIPPEVTATQLRDALHFINQAEFSPPTFEEGSSAEQQLKRKTVPRKKANFDDEDADEGDGLDDFLDDEQLFPAGGPTAMKAIDEVKKPKKSRRRNNSEEPSDAVREERARKRREREREKALKIKSALYVKEGDDDFDSDADEEFFARERAIKARAEQVAKSAASGFNRDDEAATAAASKKRKSGVMLAVSSDEDDADDDDADEADDLDFARRLMSSQEGDGESQTDDTPVDVSDGEGRKRRRLSAEKEDDEDLQDADGELNGTATAGYVDVASKIAPGSQSETANEEEDAVPTSTARRARVRGGFVIDSDDDDDD
jgi:replication fork protection complex subunit Tof1/Swi1